MKTYSVGQLLLSLQCFSSTTRQKTRQREIKSVETHTMYFNQQSTDKTDNTKAHGKAKPDIIFNIPPDFLFCITLFTA